MMPNPANEQVTVMSSYRIYRIELFALSGERVKQVHVDGIASRFDISDLPRGIYIVRTFTSHGVSTKKLVVN